MTAEFYSKAGGADGSLQMKVVKPNSEGHVTHRLVHTFDEAGSLAAHLRIIMPDEEERDLSHLAILLPKYRISDTGAILADFIVQENLEAYQKEFAVKCVPTRETADKNEDFSAAFSCKRLQTSFQSGR